MDVNCSHFKGIASSIWGCLGHVFLSILVSVLLVSDVVAQTAQFSLQTSTSSYRLGPGDGVEINVFNVPEMTTQRVILADGTVTLPIIGPVRFSGLSQEEAAAQLTELYRPYLEDTQITVAVVNPRPINVTVLGEVNRPGPYTLAQLGGSATGTTTKTGTGQGSTGGAGGGRLTVSQALSLAGGVTEVADVESITLIRPTSGGQSIRQTVNLWALLQRAETGQDIPMLDGDALIVARADPAKANYDPNFLASTTLAPSTVEVKVLGEVIKPGLVSVVPNAPMTDALVAAGGLTNNADPGAVQLLRLNPDGSVKRMTMGAVLEQGRDPLKNPSLRKGDLIVVSRSFGGGIVKGIQELGSAFLPLTFFFNLFR